MSEKTLKTMSKFMSLLLRHKPEVIGLVLDDNGWASIDDLVRLTKSCQTELTFENIKLVVETNVKKRFIISDDGKKVRANQGHSVKVDVELKEQEPPTYLYHGTASREDIMASGSIKKMDRLYVHLTEELETAINVGSRHGKPYIFTVDAIKMHTDGIQFYKSENGVWLTDDIDTKYIS